jgi:CubicO group peptidase (beta-lactamase class C family)
MSGTPGDGSRPHGISRRDLIKGLAAGLSIGVTGTTSLGAGRLPPQNFDEQAVTNPIDKLIDSYIKETTTPGVAVALYDANNSPTAQTFAQGYANLHSKTPVDSSVIFELASVTKTFTATLLGYQPEIFDDSLSGHLPVQITNSHLSEVKIVDLATHTSGFPAEAQGEGQSGAIYLFQDELPPERSALVKLWKDWNPNKGNGYCDKCEVGTCWQYSDVAYVTLGYVVAGTQYNSQLSQDITGLLSMTSTAASPPAGTTIAQGYNYRKAGPEKAAGVAPDLKSCASDMLVWLEAQLGLAGTGYPDLVAAIGRTQNVYFKPTDQCPKDQPIKFEMGLAWEIDTQTFPGYELYWKDGVSSVGGQTCWLGFLPGRNLAVAVLTNLSGGPAAPGELGNQILETRL